MQPHMQAVRRRQPHAQVGGAGITSKSKDTLARNGLTTIVDNNGAALGESREWTDNEEERLRGEEKGKRKRRGGWRWGVDTPCDPYKFAAYWRGAGGGRCTLTLTQTLHRNHDVEQKQQVEQKKTWFSHKQSVTEKSGGECLPCCKGKATFFGFF